LPLLFNFALANAIRKVQENQVGLKLNETHQLLVYADDVTPLRDNVDTIKKNIDILIDASNEVGLEIIVEKTKYMLLSCHQSLRKNHNIKIANRLFENETQFKYLGWIMERLDWVVWTGLIWLRIGIREELL
jgi:hypothetical protein